MKSKRMDYMLIDNLGKLMILSLFIVNNRIKPREAVIYRR